MDATSAVLPSPDTIRQFPIFQALAAENIIVIQTRKQCEAIRSELSEIFILGFDTESKPTFTKGEISTGPHLIQLASFEKAYLFQVSPDILAFLQPILANPKQLKVGFGLKNDAHLFRKKGVELNGIVDLAKSFTHFGIKTQMGVKNAIALLFQQHFIKNKKISTSNWSKKALKVEQILYAAADAYAALLVFVALYQQKLLSPHVTNQLKHQPELQKILLEKIDI